MDNGDLYRLQDQGLALKKRIVHSEMLVNRAIFQLSEDEARESEGIFQSSSQDKSTLISGGAGTGKTLLLIKKVAQEDPSMRILVVSRLPRLVSIIKTSTEEKREGDVENVYFSTFDELMQLMARRVIPDNEVRTASNMRYKLYANLIYLYLPRPTRGLLGGLTKCGLIATRDLGCPS